MADLNTKKYKYIQVGIASPEEIRSWAYREADGFYGEVKKHETINYRTLKPERDGLFCEVIFGPTKDRQCSCGRAKKNLNGEHQICERCGVELTESKVRREKMGFINLAAPVVHTWYLRNTPSKIAILLDMKTKDVEDIVYLAAYIVTEVKEDCGEDIFVGKILTEQEHGKYKRLYPFGKYKALTGAEAIKYLLQQLDLGEIVADIRRDLVNATKQKRAKLIKRLESAEAFYKSDNKPEWMVMDVIPVIPPDLRPMVQLEGGRFATTDLNDLYRRIISRNIRLRKQIESRSPEMIVKNEKRMLQEAVDSLIDNAKRKNKAALDKNRPLKSLSDILRGKQGRFRQNLLGKRVDYSGRSVIVIGPDLKMYQAGIPREMALILFKPFIINYLRQKEQNENALLTGEINQKTEADWTSKLYCSTTGSGFDLCSSSQNYIYRFTYTVSTNTLHIELVGELDMENGEITALKANRDSEISIWKKSGAVMITESTYATADGKRLFIVIDSEGRICYSVYNHSEDYGDPTKEEVTYYYHSYYEENENPAIIITETGYKIVIPEGGFAITADGDGIVKLAKLLINPSISSKNGLEQIVNKLGSYSDSLRLSYDGDTKVITAIYND